MFPAHSYNSDYIIAPQHIKEMYTAANHAATYQTPDNIDINRQPITVGWVLLIIAKETPVLKRSDIAWRAIFAAPSDSEESRPY